jgi:hypothetical protein
MRLNFPAFPCEAQGDRSVPSAHDFLQTGVHSAKFPGMSLRDWFAGQALSGQLANRYQDQCSEGQHARRAYDIADAMLAARDTPND